MCNLVNHQEMSVATDKNMKNVGSDRQICGKMSVATDKFYTKVSVRTDKLWMSTDE